MLFLYFNGIRVENRELVIEVSHTAEVKRQRMEVPAAFFMKFPHDLFTRTLETTNNERLLNQMEAYPDFTIVKSIRRNFGQQMVSSEPVKLETNWQVMETRNILRRITTIDNEGVPRNTPKGASYETIAMNCPLTGQLVGYATKPGQPAMIFVAAQAESAKRPQDKEYDNLMQLENEAKTRIYEIDLLNPAEFHSKRQSIRDIFHSIMELSERVANVEQEEKQEEKYASNSSTLFTEQQKNRLLNEITLEKEAQEQSQLGNFIFNEMKNKINEAQRLQEMISYNVGLIKSWHEEKKMLQEEKNKAADNLIRAGEKFAASNVIDAGLPIEGDLRRVVRASGELENDIESINDEAATQNIPSSISSVPTPASSATSMPASSARVVSVATQAASVLVSSATAVPIPTRGASVPAPSATAISTATSTAVTAEALVSNIVMQSSANPTATVVAENKTVPAAAESLSASQTPAQAAPEEPTLSDRLRIIGKQLEPVLVEAFRICLRLENIKREAAAEIASIREIVDAVKSVRVKRNAEIVNWPDAKRLIAESNSGFSEGYTHWEWYYTKFPELFVNYLFNMLMETGRWNEVALSASNTLSNNPLPVSPVFTKKETINIYNGVVTKIFAAKNLLLPPEGVTRYMFSNNPGRIGGLYNPNPRKRYKSDEAYQAEILEAEKQTQKLSRIANTLTQQLAETKEKIHLTLIEIGQANKHAESETKIKKILSLHERLASLDIKRNRLQALLVKAVENYQIGVDVLNEKRSRRPRLLETEQTASEDVQEEEKSEEPVVTKSITKSKEQIEAERNAAVERAKQLEIENGLKTSLVMKSGKTRFLELFPKASSEVKKNLQQFCQKKRGYIMNNFTIWQQQGEEVPASLDVNSKQRKM